MRKLLLIVIGVIVVLLVLAAAAAAWMVKQFDDPGSRASVAFTSRFATECVAAGNAQAGGQDQGGAGAGDDLAAICNCGADEMREDIAQTGLTGLARMFLIEGMDEKMQRVLNNCQSTPSAP